MNFDALSEKINSHIEKEIPFVLYHAKWTDLPTKTTIRGVFQHNNNSYSTPNLEDTGFVFAPFNLSKTSPLILPTEHAELKTFDFSSPLKKVAVKNSQFNNSNAVHQAHLSLVHKGIALLKKEELIKVVLARKLEITATLSPLTLFKKLVSAYPEAFVYCWFHPESGIWMGATPETLLEISKNTFHTMALAGTRSALKETLPQWTEKEIREQQLVTDFIKDRLKGRLSNLQIGERKSIKAGKLWHLCTSIQGTITKETELKGILHQLHPTPAVCGLPREAAKDFILKNEAFDREFYTGFLGEMGLKSTDFNKLYRNQEGDSRATRLFVNLRCMKVHKAKCALYVGGGILADSDPEGEWQETINKAHTMADIIS